MSLSSNGGEDAAGGGNDVDDTGDGGNAASEPVVVSGIRKHTIYNGAVPGCLWNVWVWPVFSDGVELNHCISAEPLAGTTALLEYVATPQGAKLQRFLPPVEFGRNVPSVPALGRPEVTWVQCDACAKWRLIGRRAFNQLPDRWRCADNLDPQFASCEKEQEFCNDEIDRQLKLTAEPAPPPGGDVHADEEDSSPPRSPTPDPLPESAAGPSSSTSWPCQRPRLTMMNSARAFDAPDDSDPDDY